MRKFDDGKWSGPEQTQLKLTRHLPLIIEFELKDGLLGVKKLAKELNQIHAKR